MKTNRPRRSPLLSLLFSACGASLAAACVMPPTQAELLTYQTVAPDHARYVEADPTLAPDQKQRRLDLLEAWRVRVGGAK